uniref:hypothetical protein n=1 Tax=Desulforegula conservatrix TaxID=153026 RepID=UPI0004171AF0|nr:hypothetical protein [Desulforegula conservatrix]
MNIFLYISICIVSGLFQTIVRPHVPEYLAFYDPLLIFIIYLGQKSNFWEGCIFSILSGLFMDGLSSGGIGFFLAAYIWFFFSVRWIGMYFRFGSVFIVIIVAFIGIAIQNFVFLLPEIIENQNLFLGSSRISFIKAQMMWALFTSAFVFSLIAKFMTRYAGQSKSAFGADADSDKPELIRG